MQSLNAGQPTSLEEKKITFNYYQCGGENDGGKDVVVYVVDSGYKKGNKIVDDKRVVFPQEAGFKTMHRPIGDDQSPSLHGTLVCAILAATSPRCTIAPLRHNTSQAKAKQDDKDYEGKMTRPVIEDLTKCCRDILEYHNTSHKTKSAVVNFSVEIAAARVYADVQARLKEDKFPGDIPQSAHQIAGGLVEEFIGAVQALSNRGMIVVAAAGNTNKNIDYSWEDWVKDTSYFKWQDLGSMVLPSCLSSVITVGSLNRNGLQSQTSSRGKSVHFWLLGEELPDVFAAKDDKAIKVPTISGTSFAAPALSGIIACLLSSAAWKALGPLRNDTRHEKVRQMLGQCSKAALIQEHLGFVFRDEKINLNAAEICKKPAENPK